MREACYLGNGLYTYNTGNKPVRQYAYNHETDFPVAFPVHDVCISLFENMLKPQVFDLECVYNAFKRFYSTAPSRCLTLDYGGAQQFMGNQWKVIRGEEHYVVSPLRDRALRRCQPPVGGHADFGDPDGHATHRLAPRSGYFIVGLKVYDDEGGRITGIELIQQPLAKLRGPTRRAMVDMVSAGIWSVENTKEKYWIGDDEEW
ncbi:hypothetical protein CEP53_000204 [Fusarium sp. AF-6]|nr:hypothetical protein CEP53_000204 [Fusarium sp. AF-6]